LQSAQTFAKRSPFLFITRKPCLPITCSYPLISSYLVWRRSHQVSSWQDLFPSLCRLFQWAAEVILVLLTRIVSRSIILNDMARVFRCLILNLAIIILAFIGSYKIMALRDSDFNIKGCGAPSSWWSEKMTAVPSASFVSPHEFYRISLSLRIDKLYLFISRSMFLIGKLTLEREE